MKPTVVSMVAACLGTLPAFADRPNIVYIICDDLGYGDVQCLAPKTSRIPTPHADKLAAEGMVFTDAHSGSSVCSPTRYGIMTGRYSWRTRLQKGVVTGFAPCLIASGRPTVASFLKAQGYHTGIIGKWHLDFEYLDPKTGERYSQKEHKTPPVGARIPDGPVHRGFDYYHGFHHARNMEAVIENDRVVAHDPVINMLPRLTRKSVEFIDARAGKDAPFFLYVPLGSPHTPIVPTPDWEGKSGLGKYGDFVMQTDNVVGEITKALQRHGMTDNTMVIFTSDNGCSKAAGISELARKGHAVSAHLRGSKADLWDGGHRIPFIVRWPGRVKPGSTGNQLICLTDLFATVGDILGKELPAGSCEDSASFLPALLGKKMEAIRSGVIHHSISGHFAYRQGKWKLLLARASGGWSSPKENQAPEGSPVAQLYDMENDPGETMNLYPEKPEIAARLLAQLEKEVREGRSTRGPASKNDVESIVLWKSGKKPATGKKKQRNPKKTSGKTRHTGSSFVAAAVGAADGAGSSSDAITPEGAHGDWHQAAGPNANWRVNGTAPLQWSATRNENILWRTPMPEAGMSAVTVWGDRAFTTTHVPIETEKEKAAVTDIIGFCLDANSGRILWQVTLPGSTFISLAGGFTDGTVFAPVTDGKHVWFFNRCGSIGCYDFEGNKVWLREWTPRFKHNNRQAEPVLVGDAILYVEVANKAAGAMLQKWKSPGVKNKRISIPEGVVERDVWTYVHGLDKHTGKTLWRESVGTSVHTTPVVGRTADGKLAVAHARGGGHGPLEKPYGHSLTSLAPGEEGRTLWSTPLEKYDPPFSCHWNAHYAFGFHNGTHLVLDAATGALLRKQQLYEKARLWRRAPSGNGWKLETDVAVRAGKGHPNTNQCNIVVGDWHWFLAHHEHYLGRVHIENGTVEYLELPAQLLASGKSRAQDQLLWGEGHKRNRPLNARGHAVGDKGHSGTGFGHISAASPILVGRHLLIPVVTGTVYVIDTETERLAPDSLVAVNDLGPGGETWTLASLSFSNGRLYAHTMREILCLGESNP